MYQLSVIFIEIYYVSLNFKEYELFTLRGLCHDSDIDRGYFLLGGDSRDNDGHLTKYNVSDNVMIKTYHMKPVYEGYFYTIHWVSKNQDINRNFQ